MAINNTGSRRLLVTLTALFAALCGLYLLIGGGWLVAIGGSWYYPIAGLVMLGVAWMLWRSKRAALWLYAALLLGTMIWGVWEVGFDFWALTPRSDILVFFGIWLIILICEWIVDDQIIIHHHFFRFRFCFCLRRFRQPLSLGLAPEFSAFSAVPRTTSVNTVSLPDYEPPPSFLIPRLLKWQMAIAKASDESLFFGLHPGKRIFTIVST